MLGLGLQTCSDVLGFTACPWSRDTKEHCMFALNQTDQRITSLNIVAKVYAGTSTIVWVPLNLHNNDACTQGVSCPTTPGARYTFKTRIRIRKQYSTVSKT